MCVVCVSPAALTSLHSFRSPLPCSLETVAQPGSLDAERGIFASSFDGTGTRLITCEADKSLKVWKETDQTEEEVPVDLKEWKKVWTREKRGRI